MPVRTSAMNKTMQKNEDKLLTIEDLKFDPPQLPESRLQDIAWTFFGIGGEFRRLEGERDQNCRITGPDGRQYVLKISGTGEDPEVVDFQVKALLHIAKTDPEIPVPRMVQGRDGALVYRVTSPKGLHQVRMLSYLPGILYQEGPKPSLAGLHQLGQFLARLNCALRGFEHPASGHFMPWDCTNGLMFRQQMRDLLPVEVQELAAPAMQRLEDEVYPRLSGLRSQVIHQDGHGANLLRESALSEAVVGVIDFGDMVYGPLICDLAVSLTDFIEASDRPAEVAVAMCRGFQSVLPLLPEETDLLLDLVIARQILVLQLFEFRRRNMENPPRFVITDQPGIIASLKMLTALDRAPFNQCLREVVA